MIIAKNLKDRYELKSQGYNENKKKYEYKIDYFGASYINNKSGLKVIYHNKNGWFEVVLGLDNPLSIDENASFLEAAEFAGKN